MFSACAIPFLRLSDTNTITHTQKSGDLCGQSAPRRAFRKAFRKAKHSQSLAQSLSIYIKYGDNIYRKLNI